MRDQSSTRHTRLLRDFYDRVMFQLTMLMERPANLDFPGGLDSSLVASIAQRETLRLQKEYARQQAWLNSGVNTPRVNGEANGQIPITDSNGVPVEDELVSCFIFPFSNRSIVTM